MAAYNAIPEKKNVHDINQCDKYEIYYSIDK